MTSARPIRLMFMPFAAFPLIVAAAIGAMFLHELSIARACLAGRSQTTSTSFGSQESALLGDPVLVVHGAGGGFDQAPGRRRDNPEIGFKGQVFQ